MMKRVAAVCVVLLAAGLCCRPAPAEADWPMFIGDGDRTPSRQGVPLVDHLDDAPVLWELKHHMGVGKGLYPGHLKLSRAHGIEPFYGGASSPIVAGGTVYVSYFKPDGKVPAKVESWRTVSDPQKYLPSRFFSVTADDVLLAVAAKTGEIKWEKVEKGKGHNRLGHKRGHWCVSPAYADGRVFSMGTAGLVYAYDAKSGRKLWETLAEPALQEQREQHLRSKRLCWNAGEKSSLVVAAGAVIVPHGGLTALDARTGRRRWQIEDRVLSSHATPSIWTHKQRECLVVNDGAGRLRLIDAGDGRVLWTQEGLGNQLGTVTVAGDIGVLNVGSKTASNQKANGLFGAFRLGPDGPKKLWTLPDGPEYRHSWTLDRGAERRTAIQDGRVYLVVGIETDRLVVVDLKSGRILSEHSADRAHAPYPMEDRLLLYRDRAHTDPVVASWWSIAGEPKRLHDEVGFGPRTITGYEVPIQWPYVDGLLYARTLDGLACFDLRRPADTPDNRTLHMTVPASIVGTRSDLHVSLTQRRGKLTHGGFRGAGRLHSVDTSQAKWDGRRLTGALKIDTDGYRQFEDYTVDAELREDGRLTGTITSTLGAFRRPIILEGEVTAVPRQPHWMPACTHVLQLHDAAVQEGGRPGRLLLFLTVENGRLTRIEGFADQTTQARPVVDTTRLALEAGRLAGTVRIRYRADEWARPLAEQGDTAAAEYRLDAKLAESGKAGTYGGTYGVGWLQTARLRTP